MDNPLPLDEIQALSRSPYSAGEYSALSGQPFLLFEAHSASLDAAEQTRIAEWLMQLACPVLGIGSVDAKDPITQACDVVVAQPAEAEPLLANISANPMAASVLVQLLRGTAQLPLAAALTVESLAYATLQSGPEYQRWLAAHRATIPAQPGDDGPPVVMARDDGGLTLELNRASNHNAINIEMRDALVEAFQLVRCDDSIRRVRISGRGKCFSTGGDLTEFGTVPDPVTGHLVRGLIIPARHLAPIANRVEFHVHSACIGAGAELPAFGRRISASKDAFFQLPELKFGLIPGAGGCVSLPRRIGRQRTAWLVLSGRRIGAKQAQEWGLVDTIGE